ncbi:MAG: tetratricopeptide repeat protein [Deltaproteobacteria bacterium]|nr:tetratricopeptide repeat protein [Deltaproteobacteria bacterium]
MSAPPRRPAGRTLRGLALACAWAVAVPAQARTGAVVEPDADAALPSVQDEPEAPADADADRDDAKQAMEAFARGSDNYNAAKYDVALRDFLEAASLYASPDFQYNIALCYEKLDKPEEAIAAFETYLKTKRNVPDRANVEDRIRRLREQIERRGDTSDPTPPTTEPSDGRAPGRALVISGAALLGVGAAVALGGGIGFGTAAKRRSDDLDDVQTGGNPQGLTFAEASALQDDGKRFELGQIALAAAGGAVAIVGVALLAVGLRKRAKGRSVAGKTAARWRGTTIAPSSTRNGFGLTLTGRF